MGFSVLKIRFLLVTTRLNIHFQVTRLDKFNDFYEFAYGKDTVSQKPQCARFSRVFTCLPIV